MTTDTQLSLPTTEPSPAAHIIPPERRAKVLDAYRETLGRIEAAGICLLDLRAELAGIFPASLARIDHAASRAEHAADWFLRMDDGWQAFADALAEWCCAVLEMDATLTQIRTREEHT